MSLFMARSRTCRLLGETGRACFRRKMQRGITSKSSSVSLYGYGSTQTSGISTGYALACLSTRRSTWDNEPNPRSTPGRSDGGHGGLSGSLGGRVGAMHGGRRTLLVRLGRGTLACGQPVLRLLRDRLGRCLHNGCLDGRAHLHSPLRSWAVHG